MNQNERWLTIVLQQDEKAIIPFLQQLDEAQKKALLPQLSKTAKEYLEIKDRLINHKHFYAKKASLKQERILNYSIFVCTKDANSSLHKWLNVKQLITSFTVTHLLNWYCPAWLSAYINEFGQQKVIPPNLTYDLVISMMEKGYIQPSELLLAKLFSRLIFPNSLNERLIYTFCPKKLVQYPITLSTHIWYIFDHPTQIYEIEKLLNFKDAANLPKNCWYAALHQYTQTGQLDRLRLLKACLTATSKPVFNKFAISWFIGLFDYLKPTPAEILALQTQLVNTYDNSSAKVINTSLNSLLKVIDSPDFNVENSLKNYDKLLTSSTKSVVKNGLFLLEKLAINYPDYNKEIVILATKSLVHRTENIQLKAATIIKSHGQKKTTFLAKLIAPYQSNLFQKTRQILQQFITQQPNQIANNQLFNTKNPKILSKSNQIRPIQSFSEFKALAFIVFDNQQPYHFDQFLVALLQFKSAIKGKNITALTPLFKRAYQLVFNELPSHQGMLDNILAIFLLDLADLLISQYPADSLALQKLAAQYLEQGFFIKEKEASFDLQYAHLSGWYNPYDPSLVYMPIQKLLAKVLSFLHEEKLVPLLSTPTHAPTWIDPNILVERLAIYQEKNQYPDAIDLQLAISRISFENKNIALKLAQSTLKGDYLAIMDFLLRTGMDFPFPISTEASELEQVPLPPFFYSYVTAAITKNNSGFFKQQVPIPALKLAPTYFNGTHDWMVYWEERRLEEWNYKIQKLALTGTPFIHRELQVKFKKGLDINHHPDFLYQYFPGNDGAFRPNVNDVQRLLGLLPNNPDPLIALLIADNLKYPTFWEIIARKRVVEILIWLKQITAKNYGYATHFFLAACMISADKKIRLAAAEIWKKAVVSPQINNALIGEMLGKMEHKEFAPLKRFTDLAQIELFNISTRHNQALEAIVSNLLAKLPAIPIKNTKQLLIIYRELLILNSSKITHHRLTILLELWTKSASLKKVIRELAAFC